MANTLPDEFGVFVEVHGVRNDADVARLIEKAARFDGEMGGLNKRADLFPADRAAAKAEAWEGLAKVVGELRDKKGAEAERRATLIEQEIAPREPAGADALRRPWWSYDVLEVESLLPDADDETFAAVATAPRVPTRDPISGQLSLRRLVRPEFVRDEVRRRNPEAAARVDDLRGEAERFAMLANTLVELARRHAGVRR